MSEPVSVRYGVPQGTVLGPLLFLLYINDMVKVTQKCKTVLFADDTMLYVVGKDLQQMKKDLNEDLNSLFSWLCINKLCLNADKSRFCLFSKKSKINQVEIQNMHITVNGENIVYSEEIKYLGIILDSNLNFQAHADYIMRKFSKKVGFITRIGKNLSMYTKLQLYNIIALPHLQFCSTLLYGLPQYKINQLEKIQNRAMRQILRCNWYTPIESMLSILNLLSVKQRILFNVYLFIFKLKYGLLPSYLCNKLRVFEDVHSYPTRNRTDFILFNRCNSNRLFNSILYKGLSEFNKLPVIMKNCDNLNHFKRLLRKFVLDKC